MSLIRTEASSAINGKRKCLNENRVSLTLGAQVPFAYSAMSWTQRKNKKEALNMIITNYLGCFQNRVMNLESKFEPLTTKIH